MSMYRRVEVIDFLGRGFSLGVSGLEAVPSSAQGPPGQDSQEAWGLAPGRFKATVARSTPHLGPYLLALTPQRPPNTGGCV